MAVIFKLVFSFQKDQVQKEIKMRKACVNWFGLIVYLVSLLSYFTVILFWWYELTGYIDTSIISRAILLVLLIIFTATMMFSLHRIHKYSKMLVANKIFANEKLMIIHLSCFIMLVIGYLIVLSI